MNSGCPIERRVVVTSGTMSLVTGEYVAGTSRVEIEPCGSPLFGKVICNSCRDGWEVENSQITARGRDMIVDLMGAES